MWRSCTSTSSNKDDEDKDDEDKDDKDEYDEQQLKNTYVTTFSSRRKEVFGRVPNKGTSHDER